MLGSIYGRVIHGRDGSPASAATVGISREGRAAAGPITADDHGVFVLLELPEGEWHLEATTPEGTSTASVHVFDNATSDVVLVVEAAPAQKATKRASKPRKSRPATGSVNGRVIGPDGSPRPDIVIDVAKAAGSVPDIVPITNGAGEFFLDGLPVGHVELRSSMVDYAVSVEVREDAPAYVVMTTRA